MEGLAQELKQAAIDHIGRRQVEDLDAPLMYSGYAKRTFTSRELMQEIENETPEGIRNLKGFVKLAIHLLERNKEKIDGYERVEEPDSGDEEKKV